MRHDKKKKEQNRTESESVSTELRVRHRGQTSEGRHQKRNYISRIKMRGEHERKMRGKLCKVALIQAKKKNPPLFFPFWKAIKNNTPAVNFKMALLSFLFLDLEKWFQTSSYCFLPSLENSDHTTKSTDTWMNWTVCQCYSRKKRGGEFINCTTEYEFIYTEKMRILLNESNMKVKRLCSGTSHQYLNSWVFRIAFINLKGK